MFVVNCYFFYSHDVVNCQLKEKPEWLLERNYNGKVPVLEFPDGQILYESLVVAEYIDDVYKSRPLYPTDPFQKAVDQIWVADFNKVDPFQCTKIKRLGPCLCNMHSFYLL